MKKDGVRYFRQTDTLRLVGGGLAIFGVAWYWIGMTYASYIIPTIVTPIGLVLFIISSGRHISHKDMEQEINVCFEGYDASVTARKDYDRVVLKHPAPVETQAFYMGEPAKYFRQGENSRPVSDVCVKSHYFFTKEALMVCVRQVSLSKGEGEESRVTDREEVLYFEDMCHAELLDTALEVTMTNTKKKVRVKQHELVITGKDGELLRLPVHQDMDMETLCDHINRCIKEHTP